jgi:hypothetical protein
MGSHLTGEAIPQRAPLVALVVFKMRALSSRSDLMRSYATTALYVPHTPTARHGDRKVDTDRLPQAVCPKFAIGRSGHRLFHWHSKACTKPPGPQL